MKGVKHTWRPAAPVCCQKMGSAGVGSAGGCSKYVLGFRGCSEEVYRV
jgi:hypothetical protein